MRASAAFSFSARLASIARRSASAFALAAFAGGRADGVGLGARGGKFAFVGRNRGIGLSLQAGGFVDILREALMAAFQDAADARHEDLLA